MLCHVQLSYESRLANSLIHLMLDLLRYLPVVPFPGFTLLTSDTWKTYQATPHV